MTDPRSRIPSVDGLLLTPEVEAVVEAFGRVRTVDAIRAAIEAVRSTIAEDQAWAEWADRVDAPTTYADLARTLLEADDVPSLRRVVNATGVVLHTNLGRAPLSQPAIRAMQTAAEYGNLEFDLETGARGSRYVHCVSLLTRLTGAEDALVVNNAAGALVLAMSTVGMGQNVAVSRGELVEIGGGFRIPEVLERAGARLVEVGSTNRTRVADYAAALDTSHVRAILKVHRSNFRITGFTEEASVAELADLARTHDVPFIHDLGSGLMVEAETLNLPEEPIAAESLAAGAHAVVVSGDKLLGATQAGIIVGRADLVERMRKNPLCRALRVDKVTLAGLEATLRLYLDPERARAEIPTLRMLSADPSKLEADAVGLQAALANRGVDAVVVETTGAVGGGTYPGVELPSWAVQLSPPGGADRFSALLRDGDPPVIARIVDDAVRLDVRTVLPGQADELVERVAEAMDRASS